MAKKPKFKAPLIGKKKKKRTSYSVSKDIYGSNTPIQAITGQPKGGVSQSVKPKKSVTIGAKTKTPSGGSVGVSKTGKTKTYSYKTPRGGSVGITRNPHSKGINFTSRIGEQTYIDVSADDQGTFNLGFRKKYNKGGDIEKYKDQVKRKYGGGKL